MLGRVTRFSTISKHEAKLRQPGTVISCLVALLNYIKSVLHDDSTIDLYNRIYEHISSKQDDVHSNNFELIDEQIIEALRQGFAEISLVTDPNATRKQIYDFFRDIYDGYGAFDDIRILQLDSTDDEYLKIIPTNDEEFVAWLIKNGDFYIDSLPANYDAFKFGISLRIAEQWLEERHNSFIDAHAGNLTQKVNSILQVCNVYPSYVIFPQVFQYTLYNLLGVDYETVIDLIKTRLIQMGSPLTIDFETHPDTADLFVAINYNEVKFIMDNFFSIIYDGTNNEPESHLVQLDIDSLRAMHKGGPVSFNGYNYLLDDCGETDGRYFDRKFTDYYVDHLRFVLTPDMTQEQRDTLTALRSNVNPNYTKVYFVYTTLFRRNYGVQVNFNISHVVTERTLDIINLTGLSKSVACVSLVPYEMNNEILNKVVVSFDNYNPIQTAVIVDDIKEGDSVNIKLVITASRYTSTVYAFVNGEFRSVQYTNDSQMFSVDPFFLYVVPRVADYLRGTNRIQEIRLFGRTLNEEDAKASINGYNHLMI